MKGFAFLLAFSWLSFILSLISASASAITDSTFWEEKFSVIIYRQAVGWDIRHAFERLRSSIHGTTPEERTADWLKKISAFEIFLKSRYPVDAELWKGPLLAVKPLLNRMLNEKSVLRCESCRSWSDPLSSDFSWAYAVSLYGQDWAAVEVLA